MSVAVCPPLADLERLFLGGLSDKDAEATEHHVQACRSCSGKLADLLAAKDTLAGLLIRDTESDAYSCSTVVNDLVRKIKGMRPASASLPQRESPMIAISCSACQKRLSVQEELAGKKVKCPGCGQVTAVPAKVAVPAGVTDQRTLPPAPIGESSGLASNTPAPSQGTVDDRPTNPPLSKPDATLDVPVPGGEHDTSLTDFLAPPQTDDELGRLGDYRILKILGHGGMGVVFLGEDATLNRKVAIKAMLPHLAQSATSRQRFLREARAAAALEHDHVVPIFHVGEDRGSPYIVMPFLKGQPLDERLKEHQPMPLADILRIGREIAEGLAAAHAPGLIHRDIKPANIWLEDRSPSPFGRGVGGEGRVKILDFGLARAATQDSGLTQQGSVIGTPAYMAPEQARGDTVDARCDLFSLGVVLYRMTTGQMPFHGNDTVSTLMSVAMHEPPPPVMVNMELPQELSDLVMKLLDKDVAQRIGSASEVVHALQAMEKSLASRKAPDNTVEQSYVAPSRGSTRQKPADTQATDKPRPATRSRRPIVLAAILFAVVLLGGAGILLLLQMGVIRIPTEQGDFVLNTDDPDLSFKVSKGVITLLDEKTKRPYKLKVVPDGDGKFKLDVTTDDLTFQTDTFTVKRGDKIALRAWFEPKKLAAVNQKDKEGQIPPLAKGASPLDALRADAIPADERLPWQPKELVAVVGEQRGRHWTNIYSLSFSPDGKTIACAGHGTVNARLFDATTLREKAVLDEGGVTAVAYAADGKSLAAIHTDKGLWLWDISGPAPKKQVQVYNTARAVAIFRDGKTLAAIGWNGAVSLWDVSGEKPKKRYDFKDLKNVSAMALSADGKTLATGENGSKVARLWDVSGETPKERAHPVNLPNGISAVALAPDGKTLATSNGGETATRLWDLSSEKPRERAVLTGVVTATFSPDGKTLACAIIGRSWPRGVQLYDLTGPDPVEKGKFLVDGLALVDGPLTLAFAPDSKTLATGAGVGCVQVWDVTGRDPRERLPLQGHPGPLSNAVLTPDGKTLGTYSTADRVVRLWDMTGTAPRERAVLRATQRDILSFSFSSDRKTLATSAPNGVVSLWDLTEDQPSVRNTFKPEGGSVLAMQFTPDGKSVACFAVPWVELWDVSAGEPTVRFRLKEPSFLGGMGPAFSFSSFSPDGQTLALGRQEKTGQTMVLWDLSGPEPKLRAVLPNPLDYGTLRASAWSPDGKTFAVGYGGRDMLAAVQLWDVSATKPTKRLFFDENVHYLRALSFAPDNRMLALSTGLGDLVVWDATKGNAKQARKWRLPGGMSQVTFAPEGRHLITANDNGTAYILRLEPTPTGPAAVSVEKK